MHLHKWTKWQTATATLTAPLLPKLGEWKEPVQVRTCDKCGKTQLRRI